MNNILWDCKVLLAWKTRYNFNSVPMATIMLCLPVNLRNLKRNTRKGSHTSARNQEREFYWFACSDLLIVSGFAVLSFPCCSLQFSWKTPFAHCNTNPQEAVILTVPLTSHQVKYVLPFLLLTEEIIKLPIILMKWKKTLTQTFPLSLHFKENQGLRFNSIWHFIVLFLFVKFYQ